MEFEKLFSVVVLSGAMLTSGCGKKEVGASTAVSPTSETTTETQTEASTDSRPSAPESLETPRAAEMASTLTKDGERCDEICDGLTDDGEVICPIPDGEGGTNCCWLMIPKHECCPS